MIFSYSMRYCSLQMCSCELAGSVVEKTIPYVSAPLWSVPLPLLSPNKNTSGYPWFPLVITVRRELKL